MKSKKEKDEGLYSLDFSISSDKDNVLLTTNTNNNTMKPALTDQHCNFEGYNFITAAVQAIRVQSVS